MCMIKKSKYMWCHACSLDTPPLVSNCHTFSDPSLPLERDVPYGQPQGRPKWSDSLAFSLGLLWISTLKHLSDGTRLCNSCNTVAQGHSYGKISEVLGEELHWTLVIFSKFLNFNNSETFIFKFELIRPCRCYFRSSVFSDVEQCFCYDAITLASIVACCFIANTLSQASILGS